MGQRPDSSSPPPPPEDPPPREGKKNTPAAHLQDQRCYALVTGTANHTDLVVSCTSRPLIRTPASTSPFRVASSFEASRPGQRARLGPRMQHRPLIDTPFQFAPSLSSGHHLLPALRAGHVRARYPSQRQRPGTDRPPSRPSCLARRRAGESKRLNPIRDHWFLDARHQVRSRSTPARRHPTGCPTLPRASGTCPPARSPSSPCRPTPGAGVANRHGQPARTQP